MSSSNRNGPCPACGSTSPRSGFCCDGCHPGYMEKMKSQWSLGGTGDRGPQPDCYGAWSGSSQTTPSLMGRGDACHATDEQVGGWSAGLRQLEEYSE